MKLEERYVPDPACLLQAISETDGRLILSARAPARMILKVPEMQENDMMQEALKVARKVVKRIAELEEAKKAQEGVNIIVGEDGNVKKVLR